MARIYGLDKLKEKSKCPICKKSDYVNRVLSCEKTGGTTYVYYCRRCYIEFTRKGTIRPPLYV